MRNKCDYIANSINRCSSCNKEFCSNNKLKFRGFSDEEMKKAIEQVKEIKKHNQEINDKLVRTTAALEARPSLPTTGGIFILYSTRNDTNNSIIKAVSLSFQEFIKDTKTYLDSFFKTYTNSKIEINPVVSNDDNAGDFLEIIIDNTDHFVFSANAIADIQDLSKSHGPLKINTLKEYSLYLYYTIFYESITYATKLKQQKPKVQDLKDKKEKIDKTLQTMWKAYAYLQEIKQSLNS